MNMCSQYGEELYLDQFFNNKEDGFLVDVGAGDGIVNSNSRYLIKDKNWRAILIEPNPYFFKELEVIYTTNNKVELVNKAIFDKQKELPFYVYGEGGYNGQYSTLSTEFKSRISSSHGDGYDRIFNVTTELLKNILKNKKDIDFLSIDCEGVDLEVIESNDWNNIRPKLVCVEHSMDLQLLIKVMEKYNYSLCHQTGGNSFFTEK